MASTRALVTGGLLAGLLVAIAACSGGDEEPGENRITRIDGPATVDDDAGADLDGG